MGGGHFYDFYIGFISKVFVCIDSNNINSETDSFVFVQVKMTDILSLRCRGRNFEEKKGLTVSENQS